MNAFALYISLFLSQITACHSLERPVIFQEEVYSYARTATVDKFGDERFGRVFRIKREEPFFLAVTSPPGFLFEYIELYFYDQHTTYGKQYHSLEIINENTMLVEFEPYPIPDTSGWYINLYCVKPRGYHVARYRPTSPE